MHLSGILVPIIVAVAVALIIWYAAERFSPDPFITKIIQIVVFVGILVVIITKLFPLIGF